MKSSTVILFLVSLTFAVNSASSADCKSSPVTGPCMAMVPLYFYDPVAKNCFTFIYSGCGGNGNKYYSKANCLKTCKEVVS